MKKTFSMTLWVSVGDMVFYSRPINGDVNNLEEFQSKIVSINKEKREAITENGDLLKLDNVKINGYDK
jgi:hypothetical protein